MNIAEQELISIIAEEIQSMVDNGEIDENILTRLKARATGGLQGLAGKALSAAGATGAGGEIQAAARRKKGAVVMAEAGGTSE